MGSDDVDGFVSNASGPVAFEEFELFHATTEKVTDRRLSTNRWNYSICSAILIGCAAIMKWGLETTVPDGGSHNILAASFVTAVFCIIATIYCLLWIGQIDDFKSLNKAKYDVLGQMTKHLSFSDSADDPRKSFDPFEKEWRIIERDRGLAEIYTRKIVALRSSNIEYMIPRSFIFIFAVVIPICLAVIIYRH